MFKQKQTLFSKPFFFCVLVVLAICSPTLAIASNEQEDDEATLQRDQFLEEMLAEEEAYFEEDDQPDDCEPLSEEEIEELREEGVPDAEDC